MTAAPTTHIVLDKSGVAWIDGTKVKVVEIIVDHLAYGHSAEEIQLQHPHLSLAQVHAAFAYYFDHQAELDSEIERRYRRTEALRDGSSDRFTRKQVTARLRRR
jgi:uncharacterized protein (DUF433 family)